MSQTWNIPMASSATLSASRSYLNDALDTWKTTFLGTAAPSSPADGQQWIDSDDWSFWVRANSNWYQIFLANQTYGGLLPRSGTSSYAMTGDLYMGSQQIKNLANPTLANDAVNLTYLQGTYLPLTGGTVTGNIVFSGSAVHGSDADNPTDDNHLTRRGYCTATFLQLTGGTMGGNLAMGSNNITGLAAPTAGDHATTQSWVVGCTSFDLTTGHNHDRSNSRGVEAEDLLSGTPPETRNNIIAADGSGDVLWRPAAACDYNAGSLSLSTSYQAAAQTTLGDLATADTVIVICFASIAITGGTPPKITCSSRLQETGGPTTLQTIAEFCTGYLDGGGSYASIYTETGQTGSRTYEFQLARSSNCTGSATNRGILAFPL